MFENGKIFEVNFLKGYSDLYEKLVLQMIIILNALVGNVHYIEKAVWISYSLAICEMLYAYD